MKNDFLEVVWRKALLKLNCWTYIIKLNFKEQSIAKKTQCFPYIKMIYFLSIMQCIYLLLNDVREKLVYISTFLRSYWDSPHKVWQINFQILLMFRFFMHFKHIFRHFFNLYSNWISWRVIYNIWPWFNVHVLYLTYIWVRKRADWDLSIIGALNVRYYI